MARSEDGRVEDEPDARSRRRRLLSTSRRAAGLLAGPLVLVLTWLLDAPDGVAPEAWRVGGLAGWMATWWISEAVDLAATALLPIVVLPLVGAGSIEQATAPYANPVIFLFLGGFLIALAVERWNLHRRLALGLISRSGARPTVVVGAVMLAAALLSMWVSNTATVLMLLPVVLSLTGQPTSRGDRRTRTCLLLGLAYGASIGGLGTLIGTPPNALLAGFLSETYGYTLGFGRWMLVGVPLVLVGLPLTWWLLTSVLFSLDDAARLEGLVDERPGPMGPAQRRVAIVFVATVLLWVARPLVEAAGGPTAVTDTAIALAGALVLFVLPSGEGDRGRLLDWQAAKRLPWGILVLFGGGLSLASAIERTGLSQAIADALGGLAAVPLVLLVAAVAGVILVLTELTSNTATAATFLPVLGPLAIGLGQDPLLLVVPAALAASAAFMLPVATPPNALVYGSGELGVQEMARAGVWVNLVFVVLITASAFTLLAWVLGVRPGVVPGWLG